MPARDHNDILLRFDARQTRAFDALAKYTGVDLIFNGKKASVISSDIGNEFIQDIVGYLPKRFAYVEIKSTDFKKLGITNESYVALDGVVLRVRQIPDSSSDITVRFYAHSTPDQGIVPAKIDSGSITLAIGQVELDLVFRNIAPLKDPYVFTDLYIENSVDPNPFYIGIVPGAKTATGRHLFLNTAPDTTNYVLHWRATT